MVVLVLVVGCAFLACLLFVWVLFVAFVGLDEILIQGLVPIPAADLVYFIFTLAA